MTPQPLSELIDPGWAHALAPVEDDIAQMGQFLRDENAAGRGYLPAGRNVSVSYTHLTLPTKRIV